MPTIFLAVQNSSIGDLVTDSLTDSVTFTFDITEQSWRIVTFETFVQRDMTWPKKLTKTNTKTNTKTKTKTMTYTFREHPQRALETCDLRLDT